MRLHILTIVLDGLPFLPMQLATFNRIDTNLVDWTWHIVEGAAMNNGSTAWCKPQQPRLSRDGSSEFLAGLRGHPRIRLYQRQMWNSKDEMVNTPLATITEKCLLLQVDVDELWTAEQLETLCGFFRSYPELKSARFFCRYFVGPNIIITSKNGYGNRQGEWFRAWRFEPGVKFLKHEPPVLNVNTEPCATREQTKECSLVFDHWAYVTANQVAFKEQFYGYTGALQHWRRLQRNGIWPLKELQTFLPWVGPGVVAERLFK